MVTKESHSGIASAIAMANLPQVTQAGKNSLSAALGHFKSGNAVSVGYSRMSKDGKVAFKSSISVTNSGEIGSGMGIGIVF